MKNTTHGTHSISKQATALVLLGYLLFAVGCASNIHQPVGSISTQKAAETGFQAPNNTVRVTHRAMLKAISKSSVHADSTLEAVFIDADFAHQMENTTLATLKEFIASDQAHGFAQIQIDKIDRQLNKEQYSRFLSAFKSKMDLALEDEGQALVANWSFQITRKIRITHGRYT